MSLQPVSGRLQGRARDLAAAWAQVERVWHDAKCEEFKRQHVAKLLQAADDAVRTIGEIDKILRTMQHACE